MTLEVYLNFGKMGDFAQNIRHHFDSGRAVK